MSTLRLTQTSIGQDRYRVEIALEGDGLPRVTATSEFDFHITAQQQEDLRWYLEDYLQYPFDPAPQIATRVEGEMAHIGTDLFRHVFQSSDDARDLWAQLHSHLNDTRVEIVTEVQGAIIPWELLRDPKTDTPLALRAPAFVRAHPQAAQRPRLPQATSGPIRILLIICRPSGEGDVPFRSVATRLVKGLSGNARAAFQLDVLRPPSFEQLARVLRAAKATGKPYHVVHFDGHGTYQEGQRFAGRPNPLLFAEHRPGKHGYLVFENATSAENAELVSGPRLGALLVETDVPVLVLNACRSAHAEAPIAPLSVDVAAGEMTADPHTQVRALGSLAQEVMDAGVAGVVAMRYNVYVVTAAQFMVELYAALTRGQTLGAAVTLGRKSLHDAPLREIAYAPRELQDWPVPVVYEAAPIALFPTSSGETALTITLHAADATPARGTLDPGLPPPPDVGFYGRDETLRALDRAFDRQRVVLLHAFAGSGKTSTAAEFARWYALTGGVDGPVLFASFEQYTPLPRVLDTLGRAFERTLERDGIHWLALNDAQRREVALQVLRQVPVLWLWDNVEPVAGFPANTPSAWSATEQQELREFLRAASQTQARFLLTSRRDEQSWLGDLPARVSVPAMPMQERVQLARALAEKHGRRLSEIEDWRPLLCYTEGNPLTITVVVGQALRDRLHTRAQIDAFVDRLRAGEATLDDEESEGRSRSLGASLRYGFATAFTEGERGQLALLHLFRGFVDVDTLCWMGKADGEWCVPAVRGLTREAGIALLGRAAEIGLLTARGGRHFAVHPVLPWYFKRLFDQCHPAVPLDGREECAAQATHAFVEAVGQLGNHYNRYYWQENRDIVTVLMAEEANLLHARRLAHAHGWWNAEIGSMNGLRTLYRHTGRRLEWARLVEEAAPDFVDPATDGPLPDREEQWALYTEYRVQLALEEQQWADAERLQRARLDWARQHAAVALTVPVDSLSPLERDTIRTLAVCLEELGRIQRDQGDSDCLTSFAEANDLYQCIGDRRAEAIACLNLSQAYMQIPALRNLTEAERWGNYSLELADKDDHLRRALCLCHLGRVAYERFRDSRKAERLQREFIDRAAELSGQALNLLPAHAVSYLATVHDQIGAIYVDAGDVDRALQHFGEAIRYQEIQENVYHAAGIRFRVSLALANAGRLADAFLYAQAALDNYETCGDGAAQEIPQTRALIANIERAMQGQGG